MALQSSGPISMNDIATYLGYQSAPYSLTAMSQFAFLADSSVPPHSMSEFYGYLNRTYVFITAPHSWNGASLTYSVGSGVALEVSIYLELTIILYSNTGTYTTYRNYNISSGGTVANDSISTPDSSAITNADLDVTYVTPRMGPTQGYLW